MPSSAPLSDKEKRLLLNLFRNCNTVEDLETTLRKLKGKYHPDTYGENDTIRLLTNDLVVPFIKSQFDIFDITKGLTDVFLLRLQYRYASDELWIPSGITSISEYAFWAGSMSDPNPYLAAKKVFIPKSVTSIGWDAFRCCYQLEEVIFEHGENDALLIYSGAFSSCERLKKINLPAGVYLQPKGAANTYAIFQRCNVLTELTLPPNLKIRGHLYDYAQSIQKLTIQADISHYDFRVGLNTLTEVHLDNPNILIIPPQFLQHCINLNIISGLEKVITLSDECFSECKSMTEFNLPNATDVGAKAFSNCTSLTKVALPSATDVGAKAFSNCTSLTKVALPSAINIGSTAFFRCIKLESIDLPNVTHLGANAFKGCTNLKSISLPKVVFIESGAFNDCTNLQSIVLPNSIEYVGDQTFAGCTNLRSIIVDETLTHLLDKAFDDGMPLPSDIIHHRKTDIQKIEFTKSITLKPSTSIVSIDLNLDPMLDIFGTTISCDALGVFVSLHSINHESMLINVLNSNAEYKEAVIKVSLIVT